MPKMLYKYTTLESLALILESQKIRLNPLTQMDDLQEAQSADAIKYAPYVFISSWMDEPRESIGMWKLYSNMTSGVRIGLPEMPFVKYSYTKEEFKDFTRVFQGFRENTTFSIPFRECINAEYMILNPGADSLLENVEYVDEVKLLNPTVFNITDTTFYLASAKLGKYKNTYWEFQKEKRYILRFAPVDARKMIVAMQPDQKTYDAFMHTRNFLTYYDLCIRDDAFQQMEITLAPQFSAGNEVLLNALKEKYNPNMHILESKLQGKVKL